MDVYEKIRWAPKVQPQLIARVYEVDAAGLRDGALIDDLGMRLLLRCESVLRAMRGDVLCPRCGREFNVGQAAAGGCIAERAHAQPNAVASCPAGCGWQTTPHAYFENRRNRELNGATSILAIFTRYTKAYPVCRTPTDKLLCIDRLIHEFHWDDKTGLPNRSIANNLIEGSHRHVIAFLDALTTTDAQTKTQWRQTIHRMWQRRRGDTPDNPPTMPT